MANITSSKGFKSSFRGAVSPSAFYLVGTNDFGEPAPALVNGDLTYNAGAGSLAMGTAFVKITWITAEGISLPSAEASVSVAAGSGAVTVVIPAVPTNGATVIGWQIYSAGVTATEELNTAAASTSPSPSSITTTQGAVTGYPIATTSVQVKIYGTGAVVPVVDRSGIQPAMPSISANSSADYYFVVPNAGSQWKTFKPVYCYRPDEILETAGIVLSLPLECFSPLYPGATPGSGTYTQVSVAPGVYFVMNQTLFVSIQTGSQNTASAFIGSAAFNVAKGTTVTDGSVTWLCLGKADLVHARFANVTGSAATPTAMQYDLYEA